MNDPEDWPTRETRQAAASRILSRLDLPDIDADIDGAQRKARRQAMADATDRMLEQDPRPIEVRLGYRQWTAGDPDGRDD